MIAVGSEITVPTGQRWQLHGDDNTVVLNPAAGFTRATLIRQRNRCTSEFHCPVGALMLV